jgi:hypothetical protein
MGATAEVCLVVVAAASSVALMGSARQAGMPVLLQSIQYVGHSCLTSPARGGDVAGNDFDEGARR